MSQPDDGDGDEWTGSSTGGQPTAGSATGSGGPTLPSDPGVGGSMFPGDPGSGGFGTSAGGGPQPGTNTGGLDGSGGVDPGSGGNDPGGSGGNDPGGSGGNDPGGIGGNDPGASSGGSDGDDRCRLYVNGNIPACCTPQGENRANVDEVLELLNAYRNSLGLNSLASDPKLEEAMHAHCIHMEEADFFSHTSPVTALSSPWDRAELCGASADGENIARGQSSPASVMQSWKNSPGHDSNMKGNHTLVGIGEYERNWGQVFK